MLVLMTKNSKIGVKNMRNELTNTYDLYHILDDNKVPNHQVYINSYVYIISVNDIDIAKRLINFLKSIDATEDKLIIHNQGDFNVSPIYLEMFICFGNKFTVSCFTKPKNNWKSTEIISLSYFYNLIKDNDYFLDKFNKSFEGIKTL